MVLNTNIDCNILKRNPEVTNRMSEDSLLIIALVKYETCDMPIWFLQLIKEKQKDPLQSEM